PSPRRLRRLPSGHPNSSGASRDRHGPPMRSPRWGGRQAAQAAQIGQKGGSIMLSRRVFLKNGSLALVTLGFAPSFLARTAAAETRLRRKQLIAIFQRGALDGLNMVVPFGEPAYYQARPSIAIPRPGQSGAEGALELDGFFGLHPRMAPLRRLWDARQLAIVH